MSTDRPVHPVVLLFAGHLLLVPLAVFAFYKLGVYAFPVVYLVLLATILGGIIYAMVKTGWVHWSALFWLFVFGVAAAYDVSDALEYESGEVVSGISIDDADRYADHLFLEFTDGDVDIDHQCAYTHEHLEVDGDGRTKTERETYYVAPVRRAGDATERVQLWAGCVSGDRIHDCSTLGHPWRKEWHLPHRAGVVLADEDDLYAQAIQECDDRYGLKSEAGAPVIYWMKAPRETLLADFHDKPRSSAIMLTILNLVCLTITYVKMRKNDPTSVPH